MTTTKNRYAKLETLGEGTFGIVYKASMTNDANDESYSQQFVAIKKNPSRESEEASTSPPFERLNFSESCTIHTSFL